MEEIKTVELEDGSTYIITDEIEVDEKKYLYLTNILDAEDFCIRKYIVESGEEYLSGLDNKQEFDLALKYFLEKHPQ